MTAAACCIVMGLAIFAVTSEATGEIVPAKTANWPSAESMQGNSKKAGGELLDSLLDEEKCYGRKCYSSQDCCRGSACVEMDGISGTCLPIYGRKPYQPCEKDSDCGPELFCLESGSFSPSKLCQPEGRSLEKKGFNDECVTSSDCDTDRGLCCQVMRRHRMAAKKLCYYFLDPKSCLGDVQTDLKELTYVPNPFFKARLG